MRIKPGGFGVWLCLIVLLFSLSCAPGYIAPVDQTTQPDPPKTVPVATWKIQTYNFAQSKQTFYYLQDYPWGAGTLPNGGLWFNFPQYDKSTDALAGENVNRLYDYYNTPISFANYSSLSWSVNIQTQGEPQFFWQTEAVNTCDRPASVRPVLWGWWTTVLIYPYYEWWSDTSAEYLAPGSAALNASFNPSQWSDMNGEFANADADMWGWYNFCLNNLYVIGLSFGGGCFYGHGVSVIGGSARFELTSFKPVSSAPAQATSE